MLGLCTTINIAQNTFWRRRWVWNNQYWQTFYCLWNFTTIMKNKSKFISKIFYSYKVVNICVNIYILMNISAFLFVIYASEVPVILRFSLRQTGQYHLFLKTHFKFTQDKWNHSHLHYSESHAIEVLSDEHGRVFW